MSDYPFITNQELDEDTEVICNIADTKAEAKWAINLYIMMMQSGIAPESALNQTIATLQHTQGEQ